MTDRPLRVLYLDDSEVYLREVENALTEHGYRVATASTVTEAQRKLRDRDLIIVDFHMGEMNGDAAVRILRRDQDVPPNAAFYLYTTDPTIAVNYKAYGFDGAFTRKGEVETLITQVRSAARLLKMRRFMKEQKE